MCLLVCVADECTLMRVSTHAHTSTHAHKHVEVDSIRSWSCAQMYSANFYAAPLRALRTLPFAFGTCDRRSNRQACVRIRVAVTLDSVSVVVAAVAAVIVCCFSPCANQTGALLLSRPVHALLHSAAPRRGIKTEKIAHGRCI